MPGGAQKGKQVGSEDSSPDEGPQRVSAVYRLLMRQRTLATKHRRPIKSKNEDPRVDQTSPPPTDSAPNLSPNPPDRQPKDKLIVKEKRRNDLDDREISVYLRTHLQDATLKRTKTIRTKLTKKGLTSAHTYGSQKSSYQTTLIKTCTLVEAMNIPSLRAKITPHIDQNRVASAGSFACCNGTTASLPPEPKKHARRTRAQKAVQNALHPSAPDQITCADPLCQVSTFHATCLWDIETQNYRYNASLPAKHPMKGRWMCGECVVLREAGGFVEMAAIVGELKRDEYVMGGEWVGKLGGGLGPVKVPGVN